MVIGSWMLRGSVAYEAEMGASTEAGRDAGGAIGHLPSGE